MKELRLYDVANTAGVAADLSHIAPAPRITAHTGPGQLADALYGCDLVVIPAGVPRKPGMTRDDLFNINAGGREKGAAGRLGGWVMREGAQADRQAGRWKQAAYKLPNTAVHPHMHRHKRTRPHTLLPRPLQASCARCARACRATAPAPGWPSSPTPSTPPSPLLPRCSSAPAPSTPAACLV